jgi:hypothetical protein
MATKNIVPRADGEGGLGTSSLKWKETHHVTASFGDISLIEDESNTLQLSGGPLVATSGLSGSLTQLSDGTSYLIEGTGIGIATGSSGAITISATGGGGGAGGGKHGLTVTTGSDFNTVTFASAEERQLYIVDSASAVTATLADPGTSYDGYEVNIKRLGAGTVHITGSAGVISIDGSATFDLPSQYSSVTLVATGSQFVII